MTNTTIKRHPGSAFPQISVPFSKSTITLGKPQPPYDWQLVVVYRGQHCPLCTRYLNELENHLADFHHAGVEVVAVSADSEAQLRLHKQKLSVSFPVAHGLSLEQMESLGLFISNPRSEQETDHPFAEPALFVVNERGDLHVVDISNNPFVRPDLKTLLNGINWIRDPDNNYPIRGTRSY